jgi:hypothetical protein
MAALPWRRALVSLAALAAAGAILLWIPLPGAELPPSDSLLGMFNTQMPALTVGALGLGPILTGAVLVELVALAVPSLRRLRGGPPGRRRALAVAAGLVALALAALQAWGIVRWLEAMGAGTGGVVAGATLVAGTFALWGLARLVDRFGLGNGMSLLVGASAAVRVGACFVRAALGPASPIDLALGLSGIALLVVMVLVGVRGPRAQAGERLHLRLPASGALPTAIAASALAYSAAVAAIVIPPGIEWLQPGDLRFWIIDGGLAALMALALALLFYRPAAAARLIARLPAREQPGTAETEAQALVRPALRGSVVFALVVTAAGWLVAQSGTGVSLLDALAAAACAIDLAGEWRARAARGALEPAWTVEEPWQVEPALAALAAAKIDGRARTVAQRTLWQVLGPLFPIEILVAPVDRAAAEQALAELFDERQKRAVPTPADAQRLPASG